MKQFYCFLLCLLFVTGSALGQDKEPRFYRFNNHQYSWEEIRKDSFIIFYPENEGRAAYFLEAYYEKSLKELLKQTGFNLKRRIKFFVFPSEISMAESNIGIFEPQFGEEGLLIDYRNSRILIAFKGDYNRLLIELRKSIAELLWNQELDARASFSIGFKTKKYPDWFKQGFISYLAKNWPLEDEEEFQACLSQSQINGWNQTAARHPQLSGQAFCYYLSLKYRADAGKQILFQLKIGKTFEEAVRLITKKPLANIEVECFDFYLNRAGLPKKETGFKNSFNFTNPRQDTVLKELSPDSQNIIILRKTRTSWKAFIRNKKSEKTHKIVKSRVPPWLWDARQFTPFLSWDNHENLFWVYPRKGIIQVSRYNSSGRFLGTTSLFGLDGLLSFFPMDHKRWVLNGFRLGRSDIVSFLPNTLKYVPITDDWEDETELSINPGTDKAVSIAYRVDSVLRQDESGMPMQKKQKMPGIYLNREEGNHWDNARMLIVDSLFLHWHNPVFLNDSIVQTNWDILRLTNNGSKPLSGFPNTELFSYGLAKSPWVREWADRQKAADSLKKAEENELMKQPVRSVLNDIFKPGNQKRRAAKKKADNSEGAHLGRPSPYSMELYADNLSLSLNNESLFNKLQPYQNYLGQLPLPDISAMAKGEFADVFDNNFVEFGFRLPVATSGSTVLLGYENLTRTIDWHIHFYRMVQPLKVGLDTNWKDERGFPYPPSAKVKSTFFELGFRLPMTYTSSISFSTALRYDKTVFLANDSYSLDFPALRQKWSMNNLSLSVHSTPLYAELNHSKYYRRGWSLDYSNMLMVAGQKPFTILISPRIQADWQTRVTGLLWSRVNFQTGYSAGNAKVLFVLGGVDQNLTPKTNDSTSSLQNIPYAFQNLITPLRGFPQGRLSGSQYFLLNLDLYSIPLSELINIPLNFSFIQNLNLGVFSDFAGASGVDPYNGFNKKAMAVSFGFLINTTLAGYPIRLNIGWPGKMTKAPLAYLSLDL